MPTTSSQAAATHAVGTCEQFLQRIGTDTDLPALGSAVARVVQLASSDNEAVHNLTYFVLSDVALTQKILRLSNAVVYRSITGGKPVTTISRAIFLLGFDTIKTSALALLLVDGLVKGQHSKGVQAELVQALYASVIGRELARRTHFPDAEEAAVAALFKNLGRLLVAAHEPDNYDEIQHLISGDNTNGNTSGGGSGGSGNLSETQAALQVLGYRFDALAETVLRAWNIPDSIVRTLAPLPTRGLRHASNRQEWMQQVSTFSADAAHLLPVAGGTSDNPWRQLLLNRFGSALNLDQDKFDQLFDKTSVEIHNLLESVELALPNEPIAAATVPLAAPTNGLPGELLLVPPVTGISTGETHHASGKPLNARELLLAGVQDATQMMASGRCKTNELILLVLETIYRSMGFRFATVCLKDTKSGQFRARVALGEQSAARQAGFAFPIASQRDLFHLALENDADLMISDATAANIRALIPAWHRKLLPDARSFIVLPLVLQGLPFGLFYADRVQLAIEGVPSDEASLIKILKGQVLAALNQG